MRPDLTGLIFGLGLAASAQAQPMSAIDWLTDSVSIPPSLNQPITEDAVVSSTVEVSVRPLDSATLDSVGLVAASSIGLPEFLWQKSDQTTVSRQLARLNVHPDASTLRELLFDLLVAEAPAPVGSQADGGFLLARIDKLLELGALDKAEALLGEADLTDPRFFKRWFDLSLLQRTEDRACDRLTSTPDLAPTFPATIFCLTRAGDWDAAALTLDTAEALGLVTASEDALLLRFLDGTNSAEHGPLTLPTQISPLTFRLFEAVGEPLSTEILPRAFAHSDLSTQNGWKARISAAERLTGAGVLPPQVLFDFYMEQSPAASGGVWDRVAAVQTLDDALLTNRKTKVIEALPAAWSAMSIPHISVAFAKEFGDDLEAMKLGSRDVTLPLRIRILAGSEAAANIALKIPEISFLGSVAKGNPILPPADDITAAAVFAGFQPGELPLHLELLLSEQRNGEALLAGIELSRTGIAGDSTDLEHAIRLFRSLGMEDVARKLSLELLILNRRG